MKTKNVLIVLSIILSFLSCTKTEEIDKLPPITTEGKNTFGCLVNGKAWIPKTDGGLFNERLSLRYENGGLNISATLRINNDAIQQRLSVTAIFNDIGMYQIPPPPFDGEMFLNSKNPPMGRIACTRYKCIPENTEIEIIYINTSQRIISGKFSYKNLENDCGDVINITDGRFDVRY
jgi:hypothetical protein